MRSPVGRLGAKLVAFARLFRKPKGGPYSPDADNYRQSSRLPWP
ncbi:hypothetical protein F4556_007531 [Kitasatospora gansuensis]|uniref:Uncharacterized protein n=1 Tax=Kitasatospora gansuensis TaxID=258050 RepID=A0A7W7S5Y4_9ACTN|nr:hypothetical protein [Kitasatospora gansuensis]MBB4944469.1 hypothetical protein [Kitasatospora gansuensis]MBB4951861.1 hypothetical protein [Kitasatospora gansuensis]MBB4951877.1 hypothetical protein [Kitasatospora gansuensis]